MQKLWTRTRYIEFFVTSSIAALSLTMLAFAACDGSSASRSADTVDAGCGCDAACSDKPPGFIEPDPEDLYSSDWPQTPTLPPGTPWEDLPSHELTVAPQIGNANAPLCTGMSVNPNGPCLGMCGAGCNGLFGGTYLCSSNCLQHDCCVRKKICSGTSAWLAHCQCLGLLYYAQADVTACSYYALNLNNPAYAAAWTSGCVCNANGNRASMPNPSCP